MCAYRPVDQGCRSARDRGASFVAFPALIFLLALLWCLLLTRSRPWLGLLHLRLGRPLSVAALRRPWAGIGSSGFKAPAAAPRAGIDSLNIAAGMSAAGLTRVQRGDSNGPIRFDAAAIHAPVLTPAWRRVASKSQLVRYALAVFQFTNQGCHCFESQPKMRMPAMSETSKPILKFRFIAYPVSLCETHQENAKYSSKLAYPRTRSE